MYLVVGGKGDVEKEKDNSWCIFFRFLFNPKTFNVTQTELLSQHVFDSVNFVVVVVVVVVVAVVMLKLIRAIHLLTDPPA